ncbi:MAG: hypothetical protein OHK0038_15890 [Flammeovirgaceae bacterium]
MKIKFLERFINSIKDFSLVYQMMRQFLREGCLEINTFFYHHDQRYTFTTKLQLDADILNFIPPFTHLRSDNEFLLKYGECHRKHQNKVSDQVLMLSRSDNFIERVVEIFYLLFFNAMGLYFELNESIEQRGVALTIGLVLSFLFRKFFRKLLAKIIFRVIYLKIMPKLAN